MDWLVILLVFITVSINQFLASWLYHRRIKRSTKKFFHEAKIKFPEASITLRSMESSDLKALRRIQAQLDRLDIEPGAYSEAPRDPTNPMRGWRPIGELLCWVGIHKHPKSTAPAWWTCERKNCNKTFRQRW